MRVIVALSGGRASAWCAKWALGRYEKSDVVLYFNDTYWEHPDLYRFLEDLEKHFDHLVLHDDDGRSVEELAYDHNALPNNRMPFCSRVLKAERLQHYYLDGDVIVFGIGNHERHRAERLVTVYSRVAQKSGKHCTLVFPLIENPVTTECIDDWLRDAGIEIPLLYRLGFAHNNCSGGCVRATETQWVRLLYALSEVYADRERAENELRRHTGKDISILGTKTLKVLRKQLQNQPTFDFTLADAPVECVGICDFQE